MAEIDSNNLDDLNEGRPVTGPSDTDGGLDESHEGAPVAGYEFPTAVPSKATTPDPADDATDVAIDKVLSWVDGGGAESYDVYFGTLSGSLVSIGNQAWPTYDPVDLDYETEYFWRIDSVNSEGTTTGDEWSFTTITEPAGPTRKTTVVIIIT